MLKNNDTEIKEKYLTEGFRYNMSGYLIFMPETDKTADNVVSLIKNFLRNEFIAEDEIQLKVYSLGSREFSLHFTIINDVKNDNAFFPSFSYLNKVFTKMFYTMPQITCGELDIQKLLDETKIDSKINEEKTMTILKENLLMFFKTADGAKTNRFILNSF